MCVLSIAFLPILFRCLSIKYEKFRIAKSVFEFHLVKRGECGSEEESHKKSAAKRYSMADTGAVETKNEDTSLSEQNKLENKQLKTELDELKASFQLSDNELCDM